MASFSIMREHGIEIRNPAAEPSARAASQGPYANPTSSAEQPSERARVQHAAKQEIMDMYTSYQAGFHNIFQDFQNAKHAVFYPDDDIAQMTPLLLPSWWDIRVCWRHCWGRLQATLLAVFHDALSKSLSPDRVPILSTEIMKTVTNILGVLKAKVTHNHTVRFTWRRFHDCCNDLLQTTADMATWNRLLDDLIEQDYDDDVERKAKAELIDENIDGANRALREIAKRSQELVVPKRGDQEALHEIARRVLRGPTP